MLLPPERARDDQCLIGFSIRKYEPIDNPRATKTHMRLSFIESPVITKPDRTKNTSTPTNPPVSRGTPAWYRTTSNTATARSPSTSGRNFRSPGADPDSSPEARNRSTARIFAGSGSSRPGLTTEEVSDQPSPICAPPSVDSSLICPAYGRMMTVLVQDLAVKPFFSETPLKNGPTSSRPCPPASSIATDVWRHQASANSLMHPAPMEPSS